MVTEGFKYVLTKGEEMAVDEPPSQKKNGVPRRHGNSRTMAKQRTERLEMSKPVGGVEYAKGVEEDAEIKKEGRLFASADTVGTYVGHGAGGEQQGMMGRLKHLEIRINDTASKVNASEPKVMDVAEKLPFAGPDDVSFTFDQVKIEDVEAVKKDEERAEAQAMIKSLNEQVKSLNGKVESLNGEVKSLKGEVKFLNGEVKDHAGVIRDLRGLVRNYEQRDKDLERQVRDQDLKIDSTMRDNTDFIRDNDILSKRNPELEKRLM